MEKDARYFIVGVFVILGLVAAVGFSLWLVGMPKGQNRVLYTVYFTDPVSGLKEGASVQYRGVDVGKVLDVRLDESREDLIKVDIAVEKGTPIAGSTQASLSMLGITGLIYMELTTALGDRTSPEEKEGERYPVLPGNGTQLAKILQDIPEITRDLRELGRKLNNFFDDQNTQRLSQTLENAEALSRDLNGLLTPENVERATSMIANLSEASADVKGIAARFERTADEIEKAVASLNEMVSSNKENVNRFTGEGLSQITETAREAQKAVEALRAMSDKLSRDPSQIIYKPQSRGVQIPE